MQRTVISLTDEQASRLRRTAEARGISMAAVIRDAIDAIPDTALTDRQILVQRALSVIGKYRGDGTGVAENHDDHLAEAFLDWRPS
ncbi:MAG TPA: CopG family transcriptional regulator [Candidatus Limnocylindrales bacterium]|jgi:hypothetical protein